MAEGDLRFRDWWKEDSPWWVPALLGALGGSVSSLAGPRFADGGAVFPWILGITAAVVLTGVVVLYIFYTLKRQ